MIDRGPKLGAVLFWAVSALAVLCLAAAVPQETLRIDAGVLFSVIVHVPADSAAKPPLLIVLHGRGDTASNMAGIWNVLGDPKPIVAVLEAPYPMLLTGDKEARLGESWEPLSRDEKFLDQAAPKTIKYILDAIHALRTKYQAGGVYLLGHSQGVFYAYRAALQEPELVKGVIAMAGYLDPDPSLEESFSRASAKVGVFIGHGTKDEQVDPEESRRAAKFLAERGFKIVLEEFDGGHSMTRDIVLRAQRWMMSLERSAKRPIA